MTDVLEWETLETRIDYSCPGFEVRLDSIELPDGRKTEFHSIVEPSAVVVLPFTPNGDVVVIEEWRQAVGRVNLGLPAGSVEPNDDDLTATARRELEEETGYLATTVEPLVDVEPANGLLDTVHHHVVARGCKPTGEQDLDDTESIRVNTMSFDDLLAACRTGNLKDGRAVVAILQYALTGK